MSFGVTMIRPITAPWASSSCGDGMLTFSGAAHAATVATMAIAKTAANDARRRMPHVLVP